MAVVRPSTLRSTLRWQKSNASSAGDMPMPPARMPGSSLAATFWPRNRPLVSVTAMVRNRSALSCLMVLFGGLG